MKLHKRNSPPNLGRSSTTRTFTVFLKILWRDILSTESTHYHQETYYEFMKFENIQRLDEL